MTVFATVTVRRGHHVVTRDTRPLQVPEDFDTYQVTRRLMARARKTYGQDARIDVTID